MSKIIIQESITNYWEERADSYSENIRDDMNSFKKEAWKRIIKNQAGEDVSHALDMGAGPGFFSIIMAELGFNVTVVDCAEKMVQEAENNLRVAGFSADFRVADCHCLPFEDKTFDLIICRNLVWTLVEPVKAYQEWHRLLKDSGKLVIVDANWFLRLHDDLLQKKYEEQQKKAMQKGYIEKDVSPKKKKECRGIAEKLPLTYHKRPEWDEQALNWCGFREISVQDDISPEVYDERQKALYGYIPLFSICAEK